jgi:dynein heavy chain
MNTVMDANKVLTLVSNERIPLSAAMRMVFEIDSLQNASPATVSRAGILYINETDIGWRPRVDAWVQNLDYKDDVKVLLERLVDKYMETIEGNLGKDVKNIIPLRILAQAGTVCSIMSGIFDAGVNPEDLTEVQLESYFVFACTWAYGGGVEDNDQKKRFHEVWTSSYQDIKYPSEGECFDYFYSHETNEWGHWQTKLEEYEHPGMIGEELEFF